MTAKNDNVKSALKLSFKKLDSAQPTLNKISPKKDMLPISATHNFATIYGTHANDQNMFLFKSPANETLQLPYIKLNKSVPRQRAETRRLSGNQIIRRKN